MKHVLFIIALLTALGARAQNASLTEYTGKYKFGEGASVSEALVELKDNKLVISSDRGAASLTRLESDSFAVDEYGGYVAFRRNATKLVSGLKVSIPAADIDIEGVKADSAATQAPAKLTVNTQRAPFVRKGGIDLQAHQGGCGLWPCNTLVAFINAVKMGVNTLEMDCVISKDNMVLLSHDQFMDYSVRTPQGKDDITQSNQLTYNIFTMPYDSVRQYDAGSRTNPYFPQQQKIRAYKPLLAEVIDSVEHYVKAHKLQPVQYNIEIKSLRGDNVYHPAPGVFTDLVANVINQKGVGDRVLIQSFDIRALQYLHEHYPALRTSYLLNGKSSLQESINRLGFVPDVYSPEYKAVTATMVQEVHQMGMALIPWTIDKQEDLQHIIGLDVDGIITNYPDLAIKLLNKRK